MLLLLPYPKVPLPLPLKVKRKKVNLLPPPPKKPTKKKKNPITLYLMKNTPRRRQKAALESCLNYQNQEKSTKLLEIKSKEILWTIYMEPLYPEPKKVTRRRELEPKRRNQLQL